MNPKILGKTEIRTVCDLLAAEDEAAQVWGKELSFFRGQLSSDWPLQPAVLRHKDGPAQETNLAIQFKLSAPSRYAACPTQEDDASWLLLMRHYGLPTRLLDWTKSILIAGFFATWSPDASSVTRCPGAIWAIHPEGLNLVMSGNRFVYSIHDLERKHFHKPLVADPVRSDSVPPTTGLCLAVAGAQLDARMLVQQAVFTIHTSGTPIDELMGCVGFLRKFEIPADSKPRILADLDRLGINEMHLFPDLEHLAHSLKSMLLPPLAGEAQP